MEPIAKNTKKKAKKASAGGGRSSGRGEKQVAALPVDILASWRDEEELIGYEPEVPPSFSSIQDDISVQEDRTPTQEEEQHYFPLTLTIYPHLWRRMTLWRGESAREIFLALPAHQALFKIPTSLI